MTTVILAILLLGLVATGTAIQDICDQEAVGTRLAHPDDCAKFVVCGQQQVARTSICSLGLHFNRYTGECDFKASARCESSNALLSTSTECACSCCCDCCSTPNPTPTPDTPGPDTPTPPVTPGPGTPTPPVTPSPATPGPATPGPGTPGPGTPGPATPGPATPGPGTPGPGTPGPGTPTPGPDGCSNDLTVCKVEPNNSTHIYEGYCNKWITCQNGCSIILTCPNNLQWVQNGTDSYCDYPENISPKCPWPSAPPETGPSGISCTNQGKCAGAKEGYMYVNPDNSNLYNVCQCECPIAMKCPGGLVFNTELNVCDWPPLN